MGDAENLRFASEVGERGYLVEEGEREWEMEISGCGSVSARETM